MSRSGTACLTASIFGIWEHAHFFYDGCDQIRDGNLHPGVGPWRVWHPSGAGLKIDLWVHVNPPRGQDGCRCQFALFFCQNSRTPEIRFETRWV
jgi:hypothetical protein